MKAKDPELEASYEVLLWAEPTETSEDEPIVRIAKLATKEALGREAQVCGFLATTDAMIFNSQAKIPTIVALGPERLEDAHSIDEHVSVREVVDAVKIYSFIAAEYLTGS